VFDKEVKGFVYSLEGSSQTHKMQLPKDSKMARKCCQNQKKSDSVHLHFTFYIYCYEWLD